MKHVHQKSLDFVLVMIVQLLWTMYKICKVWGSNPGHHKKKKFRLFLVLSHIILVTNKFT